MKKKIIISVTNSVCFDRRMIKTANTLIDNGYEVVIVGIDDGSDFNHDYSFHIHRLKLKYKNGKFFYLEYNYKLWRYLLSEDFDILCAVDLDTIIPNVLVSKFRNKKVVCDLHEFFTEVPELVGRKFEKSIWEIVESFFLAKCDQIYTVSTSIANHYQEKYKKECPVIFNYPQFDIKTQKSDKENAIVYIGDLNKGRGLELIIEAIRDIDIELWVLGDGIMMEYLEDKIKEYNLDKKVTLYGKVNPGEIFDYLKKAKYGLNVLNNQSLSYYYSLANKYFDYVHADCIPISMNYPEYRKINQNYHCSVLIDNYEVKELKETIISLQNDDKRVEELRKNCNIAAANFQWKNQEKLLCSIYNDR